MRAFSKAFNGRTGICVLSGLPLTIIPLTKNVNAWRLSVAENSDYSIRSEVSKLLLLCHALFQMLRMSWTLYRLVCAC